MPWQECSSESYTWRPTASLATSRSTLVQEGNSSCLDPKTSAQSVTSFCFPGFLLALSNLFSSSFPKHVKITWKGNFQSYIKHFLICVFVLVLPPGFRYLKKKKIQVCPNLLCFAWHRLWLIWTRNVNEQDISEKNCLLTGEGEEGRTYFPSKYSFSAGLISWVEKTAVAPN